MKEGNVMATEGNADHISTGREPPASPESGARPPGGRSRRVLVGAVIGVAALAAVSALAAVGAFNGNASALTNCAAAPSRCGFPDATNTGVPAGTTLKSVPAQVSSGPGWSYSTAKGDVIVTGTGTVLSGLYIPHEVLINASSVTVKDVQITVGGDFGIALTHTKGVTIEDSSISGLNATVGRVGSAIDDEYGDSTGIVIRANNISAFKTAIQISSGLAEGNYIHAPGYLVGDHTNGFFTNGGSQALTIENNTIFNGLNQTDGINLDSGSAGVPVANKTVEGNFLAGGSYTIYGGNTLNNATSNIVIKGNRFGQQYHALSGQYGAIAYFNPASSGNSWSANIWDSTGGTIPAP
jgi:hypothetical protein